MKILVADDDKTFRDLVFEILTQNGYDVIAVENGHLAWEVLEKEKIDMAVLDINMPIMDGFELLHKMKEDERFFFIPILMLTIRTLVEDQVAGYKYGADDYLPKPFDVSIFLARIKVLERNVAQ